MLNMLNMWKQGVNKLNSFSTNSRRPLPNPLEINNKWSLTSRVMSDSTACGQREAGLSDFGINAHTSNSKRARHDPTFQCYICKRRYEKLDTQSHSEERKQIHNTKNLGTFGLSNPEIIWVSRRFHITPNGKQNEIECVCKSRLFTTGSFDPISSEVNTPVQDRFVCPNCPCRQTFYYKSDLMRHKREVHPLRSDPNGNEQEGLIELVVPCYFCLVASSLIENMHISDPPPLLSRKENTGHRNPFCVPKPNSCQTKSIITQVARENSHPTGHDSRPPRMSPEPSTSRQAPSANVNLPEASNPTNLVRLPQRRILYNGVEILKCASSLDSSKEFRQCSRCNFILPFQIKSERRRHGRNVTSLKQLKAHIRSTHRRQPRVAAMQRRRQIFQKPAVVVDSVVALECEICGYPFSMSTRNIRTRHKFSHMNEEDRYAALARGEGGAEQVLWALKIIDQKGKNDKKIARL